MAYCYSFVYPNAVLHMQMKNLNYGVVGNCRTAALISERGSIDWLCFPDFDSPSVFARLLDEQKGGFLELVVAPEYQISQCYQENTNILCTRFSAAEGCFEVWDFMPRYKIEAQQDYYTPPELYRYIRHLSGTPQVGVRYQPGLNYARDSFYNLLHEGCIKTISPDNSMDSLFLYSDLPLDAILQEATIPLQQDAFLLLSYNQKIISIDLERAYLEYCRTQVYWLNWANRSHNYTLYDACVQRSTLILKLMTFQRTGAMLAALTTSLPESIGEVRNWDYRFCWLRDASMSIETLLRVGHPGAARRFMDFVQSILKSKHDTFQIMYGIRGERLLTEETLDHLDGYEGSKPVRIGNDAYHQMQNDSYGYLMNVIYYYYKHFQGTLDDVEDSWMIVKHIMNTVIKDWQKPDKGIWEIRGAEQHFVFSKIMCWVAIDKACQIAHLLDRNDYTIEWRHVADTIRDEVFSRGWSEELESFTQTYDNRCMDASLLLMQFYGFIEADDPRYVKTVRRIYQELSYQGLLFRYNNEDDFGTPTSAFTICTFWMVQALYRIGDKVLAREMFDKLLACSNHLGLFSEDLDFDSKRLLGNFPQAYSHLALIETAMLFGEKITTRPFIMP